MKKDTYKRAEEISGQIKRLEKSIEDLNSALDGDNGNTYYNISIADRFHERTDYTFSITKKIFTKVIEELREDYLIKLTSLDEEFKEL